jgi:parallel beta-helix repeat protein
LQWPGQEAAMKKIHPGSALALALCGALFACGSQEAEELDSLEGAIRCDRNPSHSRCDTVAPTVEIGSPTAGAVLSDTVSVSGSASDNRSVAKVEVSVDDGAHALSTGTTGWSLSLDTRLYPNGTHTLTALATDAAGNSTAASVTVTISNAAPPPPPPPPSKARGPQATITCPAGAVDIVPGADLQSAVNAHPGGTTFCIRAGIHSVRSSTTPKTGDTFIGEYGAVLDGTGWALTTIWDSQAAFRAHNEDIDDVTIKNLVIRNMPNRAIHAYYWMSDRWTIENNELAHNMYGCVVGSGNVIRNNIVHHNFGSGETNALAGGSFGTKGDTILIENNEFAYNGSESKVMAASAVTFRGNWVHHNLYNGIWFDGAGPTSLIEGNLVEDNGFQGIFYESSYGGIIRNNTVRRNPAQGIRLGTSKDVEVYGNVLEDNGRGITIDVTCIGINYDGAGWDLSNNSIHDNVIKVGTAVPSNVYGVAGAPYANGMSAYGCTEQEAAPYLNGSKNNRFSGNRYYVPSLSGSYWFWSSSSLSWSGWQASGQDPSGSLESMSSYVYSDVTGF